MDRTVPVFVGVKNFTRSSGFGALGGAACRGQDEGKGCKGQQSLGQNSHYSRDPLGALGKVHGQSIEAGTRKSPFPQRFVGSFVEHSNQVALLRHMLELGFNMSQLE